VVIAAVVFSAPGPDSNLRSAIALHDFAHVVAFGVVTVLFAIGLDARSHATIRGRVGATCLAAGAALTLGAIVEVAQAATGLHGDPWDVVRDGGGALSVALILVALGSGIWRRLRVALAGAAILVLAAFMYPLFAALHDEARARTQFPVLASFETRSELSRFNFGEGMRPRIVSTTDDKGRAISAIQLNLPPGKYPGFELRYFPRDWRGMRALELMIVNPESTPTAIAVRIDDVGYRFHLYDRYNRSFPLSPGLNRIEIPLSDVAAAPRDRRFDLARVHSLLVFAVDLKQPRSIVIGPITLLH
jgi:hypothetical protein